MRQHLVINEPVFKVIYFLVLDISVVLVTIGNMIRCLPFSFCNGFNELNLKHSYECVRIRCYNRVEPLSHKKANVEFILKCKQKFERTLMGLFFYTFDVYIF